jgi:hypothetical protein
MHMYQYTKWQVSKLNDRFLAVKDFKNVNKKLRKTNALVPTQVYLSGSVTLKMPKDGYTQQPIMAFIMQPH